MSKLQTASVPGKETIYVDIDDEITAIIDKVQNAKGKVIALVLPKRAPVLQSVVNMKLLKRSAENASKNLVLITSEAGLLPLAGSVGLHVADTPSSKPSIPNAPAEQSDEPEDVDEPLDVVDGAADDFDPKASAAKSVGELAGAGAVSKLAESDIEEDIELDEAAEDAPIDMAAEGKKPKKPKKNKKLAIPNFDSFRKKIALGVVVLALLITGLIYALVIMPKATVTIHTDSSTVSTNLNLTLDSAAKALDTATNTVPATVQTQQKTVTQQVATTGQINNGDKANGSITVVNCSSSDTSLPAGTSVTASGHTFITQSSIAIPDSNFTSPGTGSKCKNDGKANVNVVALKGGADYNLAATTYTISGSPSGLTATGTAMAGGTDNITKIVAQSDIDSATTKITSTDSSAVKQQVVSALQAKGLDPIESTYLAGSPQITTSAQAGATADSVTVTGVTSFTMLGIKKSDLTTLVTANVNKQIDKSKQVILDDGVANATFSALNPATASSASVSMHATSVAGPQIDIAKLKTQLVGKKSADVKSFISETPGVTSVEVKYSPGWVSSVPKKATKLTITIDKSGKQ